MARPYIIPIGLIDRTTDNRTIFLLNNPEDSLGLKLDTPVTVWRYSPETTGSRQSPGVISAVGEERHRHRQSSHPPAADHPIWQQPFLCRIGQNT